MRRLSLPLFLLMSSALPVLAQSASLAPTGELRSGQTLTVRWTGPNGQGDWVGLAPVGSAGSAWVGASYAYTNMGNPVSIPLPAEGGSFELRYVTGASQILTSIPVTIPAPPQAPAASK